MIHLYKYKEYAILIININNNSLNIISKCLLWKCIENVFGKFLKNVIGKK